MALVRSLISIYVSTKYRCHSFCHLEMSLLGGWVGRRAGAEPSVAQRSTGDRLTGARNRTRYLPSGR